MSKQIKNSTGIYIHTDEFFKANAWAIRKRAKNHKDVVISHLGKEYEFTLIGFLKKLGIGKE